MTHGPETRFIMSVHRLLPPEDELHREKMANPYRGGTADSWYSGKRADLWIEWKFIELPKRETASIDLIAGKDPVISVLQQDWIKQRLLEGRAVWVGVGCKAGGVVFTDTRWASSLLVGEFRALIQSRRQIADQILTFTQKAPDEPTTSLDHDARGDGGVPHRLDLAAAHLPRPARHRRTKNAQ